MRSGPAADPRSGRSERRGYRTPRLKQLPADGFAGRIPGLNRFIPSPTKRHRELWNELWRTPQAAAWIEGRWQWTMIADLVRAMARNEEPDAKAAFATTVRQLRDELGLTAAGLRANGWEISDQVADRRPMAGPKPLPRRLQPEATDFPPLRLRGNRGLQAVPDRKEAK